MIEEGFEPSTHSLEGCCSIQLSYPTRPPYTEYGIREKRCKGNCLYCKHQICTRFFVIADHKETTSKKNTPASQPPHTGRSDSKQGLCQTFKIKKIPDNPVQDVGNTKKMPTFALLF